MFRGSPQLTHLELRKKLLLAESEINRAELVRELKVLKHEVNRLKKQAVLFGSIASSASLVASAASLLHRHFGHAKNSDGHEKPSWITTAMAGARLGTSLFRKIKSLFGDRE